MTNQPLRCRLHLVLISLLFLSLCFTKNTYSQASQNKTVASTNVLILYDAPGLWNWIGYMDGVFLANLLGHFDRDYTLLPVEQYSRGLLEQFDTTFYFGTVYNNPLPAAFMNDVSTTKKTVVWFKYNLWQLGLAHPDFSNHYGFIFNHLDRTGYPHILYKGQTLGKNQSDPELGRITVTHPSIATTPALAEQSDGHTIPYIVHGANLWYVADIPFTFMTENDRYLVFADLLYDILQVNAQPQKRALLRLEDIDPTYNIMVLKNTADYLYSQHIPFAIAVIPYYIDPFGHYNHGQPNVVKLTDRPAFIAALNYMASKGGQIIMHGYTHQYAALNNPYAGISGADYEFFRVMIDETTGGTIFDQPLPEDSLAWVEERIQSAKTLFLNAGFEPAFWETPHYAASAIDNQFFARSFSGILGRVWYFDKEDTSHHAGQFFPYVIHKDVYGGKIIPENLGCVAPNTWINHPTRSVDDILLSARNNLVVRDAWASFYYHPFLGLAYLQQLIPALKEMGYEFVSLSPDLK